MDGILLINKEMDMTSHDVVNILRRKLGTKRIGHTGTLDPNATGLLLVLVGRYTKLTPFLLSERKTYSVEMVFGKNTDTYDIWGNVLNEVNVDEFDYTKLSNVLASFIGKSMQTPPIYSAIKLAGKKLYEYARENKKVEIAQREIEIKNITIDNYRHPYLSFTVDCSSGTYIRSLCVDIAKKLDSYGCMTNLVRTQMNGLTLNKSLTLSDVNVTSLGLINPLDLLQEYEMVEVDNPLHIYHGKSIEYNSSSELLLMTYRNEPLAFYQRSGVNVYSNKRGLW